MENEKFVQQVDQALSSLDGIRRAEANPYLYTRIAARLAKRQAGQNIWDKAARLVARPVYTGLVVAILLIANYAVLHKTKERKQAVRQDIEQIFSAEFATSNLYSIEAVADR